MEPKPQQVSSEEVLAFLQKVKVYAEEEKKAKATTTKKEQDGKDGSYQVTYTSSFRT